MNSKQLCRHLNIRTPLKFKTNKHRNSYQITTRNIKTPLYSRSLMMRIRSSVKLHKGPGLTRQEEGVATLLKRSSQSRVATKRKTGTKDLQLLPASLTKNCTPSTASILTSLPKPFKRSSGLSTQTVQMSSLVLLRRVSR